MGVAATGKRYFRLIDLCPGFCFNQLRVAAKITSLCESDIDH